MVNLPKFGTELFRLYERYVGEPDSGTDVYGYWTFVAGYFVGAAGVLVYLVGPGSVPGAQFALRETSIALAATGLSVGLFGIVLLLPVRRRAIQVSAAGLLVALVGVGWFLVAYPNDWYGFGADYTAEVMAVYTAGNVVLAGVTALVPVLTGRKGMFVAEEGASETPPIMVGEARRGAMFAVFRDAAEDWTWRVVRQEAVVESEGSAATRPDAEAAIERLRGQIGTAGLLEVTTAAFRLYETEAGRWRWLLMRDDGSVVAESGTEFDERDGAEASVSFLKDRGPTAGVVDVDGAAFSYEAVEGEWRWDLLDEHHEPLAASVTTFDGEGAAEAAAHDAADRLADARTLAVEGLAVELYADGGEWRWRILEDGDRELAASTDAFPSRRDAESAAEDALAALPTAPVAVAGDPAFELYEDGDEWRWRLVDGADRVVAHDPGGTESRDAARLTADDFAEHATGADVVDIEDATYEVYPDGDDGGAGTDGGGDRGGTDEDGGDDRAWRWRLVTEDREVLAASSGDHPTPDAAESAIADVARQVSQADLIEFENAAFQVYEAETGGEWRWRLIDEDGGVMADSGEEHTTRDEATRTMATLKRQAPDAELLEIETAAFELFETDGEWGWRLIDEGGRMVAECPRTYDTSEAARAAMRTLREHADAGTRTVERATVQPYARGDDWHWRFVLPDGRVVAESATTYPTRDELVAAVEPLRAAAADASSFAVDELAVQVVGDGPWSFRLLDRDRVPVAEGSASYENEAAARYAVDDLRGEAASAPVFAVGDGVVWLTRRESGWTWRLLDADRETVAAAPEPAPSRDAAEADVARLQQLAPGAGRVDFGEASFELVRDDAASPGGAAADDDRATGDRAVASDGGQPPEGDDDAGRDGGSSAGAEADATPAADGAAPVVREDHAGEATADEAGAGEPGADGGPYGDGGPGDARWRWRLLDADRTVVSTGVEGYESRAAARDAVDDVRSLIDGASILEIDSAAFELHREDDGWRWRLVDENGTALAGSVGAYETRTAARDATNDVKELAPDGHVAFTE